MSGFSRELVQSVEVRIKPTDEGELRVLFVEYGSDGEQVIHSTIENQDFFSRRQPRQTLANNARDKVSDGIDGDKVKDEFERFCSDLDANHEETKEKFRSPTVDRLLNETQAVDVFVGDPTITTVRLKHNGREEEIDFTQGEWVNGNPAKLENEYYQRFVDRINVEKEDWNDLIDAWDEEATVVDRESLSTQNAIVERVIGELSGRVTPFDYREALTTDERAAWYDPNNSADDGDVADVAGADADVLWVKSDLVQEALKKAGRDPNAELPKISRQFKKNGYAYTTTKRKSAGPDRPESPRCFGFDPEVLGIDREHVQSREDGEEEVEP